MCIALSQTILGSKFWASGDLNQKSKNNVIVVLTYLNQLFWTFMRRTAISCRGQKLMEPLASNEVELIMKKMNVCDIN